MHDPGNTNETIDELLTSEELAYTDALMGEIDKLAESTGSSKESVAQAFLAVRGELETDEQALDMLRDLARRNPKSARRPHAIIVPGGTGPRLSRVDTAPDGTPDPVLAAKIAEGRVRYHLDTLTHLEAESHLEPEDDGRFDSSRGELPPYNTDQPDNVARPMTRGDAAMSRGVSATILTIAAIGGLLPVGIDRVKARDDALTEARRKAQRPIAQGPTFKVKDARTGCGSAGCRSFDKCLCTCRRCREACLARKSA